MVNMASVISVANETNSSVSRTTRDGRKLTYEMTVLQQPQRARACGSGAKSSADRRPVDPPPVVELKIFEGENRKDITFQHNATFFLFTTLEPARPIATPRGSSAVGAPHPVLTGMPVAGMAYLDRPTQAGYFIFPDLSVRHEGKFRLSFNLYEETKESKDGDVDAPAANAAPGGQQMSFRLEVKSMPFTVFSAKKFPGLAESTSLSRLVAEQGCRVRIRRDVRMRRRDAKSGGKDFDGGSDDEYAGYQRNDRYNTPDNYHRHHERPASANEVKPAPPERPASHDTPGYYQPPPPQSQQQHQPPPPPQYAHPHPPPPSTSHPSGYSHLQFGSQPAAYQQQPSPSYPTSSGSYYSQPAPQHRPTSSSGSAYSYPPPRSSAYPAPPSRPSSYHDSEPSRSRAPSGATYVAFDYPAVDQQYTGPAYPSNSDGRSTPSGTTQLPPLKTLTGPKYEPSAPPSASSPPVYDSYGTLPTPTTTSAGPASGKRAYGRTFADGHGLGLHNGARPDAVGQDHLQVECEDGTLQSQEDLDLDCKMLSYRRADGTRHQKRIPQAYP